MAATISFQTALRSQGIASWAELSMLLRSIVEDDEFVIVDRGDDFMQSLVGPAPGTGQAELQGIEYRDSGGHFTNHNVASEALIALYHSFYHQDGLWKELLTWDRMTMPDGYIREFPEDDDDEDF